MKKSVKNLSAFLAVLMMSSAFAASVSALDTTFIKVKNTSAAVVDEAAEEAEAEVAVTGNNTAVLKTSGWVKTGAHVLDSDSKIISGYVSRDNDSKETYIYKNTRPLTVKGGKYYSKKDAEKELAAYFESHTYDVHMYEGDERMICDDAYYYVSSDSDVVYYDYKENRLVANDYGNAYVYVYTKGGVPFFRLDVSVVNKINGTYSTLDLIPEDWHLDGAGDTTTFTIVTDKDYDLDDFELSVVHGKDIASFTKSGKLVVTGSGPIVVRASLKKNANIYGETLLYSGSYVSYFYDGYYSYRGNQYVTDYWGCDYDIGYVRDRYIHGWIKSAEGIMIPVLKKTTGTIHSYEGEKEGTIVKYENISLKDLLLDAYGDKDDIYEIISKYNLFKGKDFKNDTVSTDDLDYLKLLLSQALKGIED